MVQITILLTSLFSLILQKQLFIFKSSPNLALFFSFFFSPLSIKGFFGRSEHLGLLQRLTIETFRYLIIASLDYRNILVPKSLRRTIGTFYLKVQD